MHILAPTGPDPDAGVAAIPTTTLVSASEAMGEALGAAIAHANQ